MLRSFSHEFVHHTQALKGKIKDINTQKTSESEPLSVLEEEAYRDGNLWFREWLESI